jgi:hypothetical protein
VPITKSKKMKRRSACLETGAELDPTLQYPRHATVVPMHAALVKPHQ